MKCALIPRISRAVSSPHLHGAQPPEGCPGIPNLQGQQMRVVLARPQPLLGSGVAARLPRGSRGTRQSPGPAALQGPGFYLTQHQGLGAGDPPAGKFAIISPTV